MTPYRPTNPHPSRALLKTPKGEPLTYELFKGATSTGCEFLVRQWSDGRREVMWRANGWESWSPPTVLTAVPAEEVAS